jgi:hypothetical protein
MRSAFSRKTLRYTLTARPSARFVTRKFFLRYCYCCGCGWFLCKGRRELTDNHPQYYQSFRWRTPPKAMQNVQESFPFFVSVQGMGYREPLVNGALAQIFW